MKEQLSQAQSTTRSDTKRLRLANEVGLGGKVTGVVEEVVADKDDCKDDFKENEFNGRMSFEHGKNS